MAECCYAECCYTDCHGTHRSYPTQFHYWQLPISITKSQLPFLCYFCRSQNVLQQFKFPKFPFLFQPKFFASTICNSERYFTHSPLSLRHHFPPPSFIDITLLSFANSLPLTLLPPFFYSPFKFDPHRTTLPKNKLACFALQQFKFCLEKGVSLARGNEYRMLKCGQ